ncbi:OmpA family protein [Falsiruegeria litorea]|uniref:OmpA family protein n=1 Tax=Falsiruegeria litorea TaxID=1280831 RepID=UPI001BFD647E|nr:OmpA family protein [Falsiruegeria litorea]MBT8167429.1 OmpA family protein [Falsiruegeria litorea]
MRIPLSIVVALTFLLAAGVSLVAASFAVTAVEENSEIAVRRTLDEQGHAWAEVQADGLRVIVSGTAKDEATRFNALSVIGGEVDPSRVIDQMKITPTADLAAPRFSAEILRNDSGVSIIGLIPSSVDRDAIIRALRDLDKAHKVTDLLEMADYPKPSGWDDAMSYAMAALRVLPRSKVSVSAGRVAVIAISDSRAQKEKLEQELTKMAPPSLRIGLDIAAPRPVITPFTLRFILDETGPHFDACSAQDDTAKKRILNAAHAAGLEGNAECTVGMGVPSPNWARASELSIQALSELKMGSVTISDADITLIAAQGTDPALFDRVIGELETALPDVFALHPVLPEPETKDSIGPPEFTATRSPEGLVQLRGRLGDENLRRMVDSYAKAAFGSSSVYTATRLTPDLPSEWPVRVLAGLEVLSFLKNGALTVTPDKVSLRGVSEQKDAKSEIARHLSEKLGEAQNYALSITYQAPPEPLDKDIAPEECEARIADIQSRAKIAFEPGSATIATESLKTVDLIAEVLKVCGPIRMEIQGHTDSQGRATMNQQLSQSRAQSVLNELRARRILTSSYGAVGYGETQPIGDNDTEEGREENRRITFRYIRPADLEETETTLDAIAEQPEGAVDGAPATPASQDTKPAEDNAPETAGEDQ